jgi:hypothetical protein
VKAKNQNKHDRENRKTHLMYSLNQLTKFIPLVLVCFALRVQATPNALPPPTPDGCYPGFTTAEGCNALFHLTTGAGNTGVGWFSLFFDTTGSFNTALGAGTLVLNTGDSNTAVGAAAMLLNTIGHENVAVGTDAMVRNLSGVFNDGVGAFALQRNTDGFSNNALGDSALFSNVHGALNTAIGDEALENNDSGAAGMANNNTAVGGQALLNNVNGSENTAVGTGAGPHVTTGFNNTYVGDFVGSVNPSGTPLPNESNTIRIGDLSNGNGAGSLQCYIGGIFNNPQPVGGTVVEVTIDLANDHLGFALGPNQGSAPAAPRSAPQPRARPQLQHQAMLNDKVEKLQATVAQQQKQIETLTAQLREQATQIQKVSAQVEMIKPAPRVVENR